mmetsp:Transcript_110871/g.220513  ORF Transcript_110871/g.220513 Transcript_110871/m.220513 type:complete len:219 (+) Transcript_110871:139-795(+)
MFLSLNEPCRCSCLHGQPVCPTVWWHITGLCSHIGCCLVEDLTIAHPHNFQTAWRNRAVRSSCTENDIVLSLHEFDTDGHCLRDINMDQNLSIPASNATLLEKEMNVMAAHWPQAILEDLFQVPEVGPMQQARRQFHWVDSRRKQLTVDAEVAVALVCTNLKATACAPQRETLLSVLLPLPVHNVLNVTGCEALFLEGLQCKDFGDQRKAVRLELQPP